jgi:hypothetical protein
MIFVTPQVPHPLIFRSANLAKLFVLPQPGALISTGSDVLVDGTWRCVAASGVHIDQFDQTTA